MSDRKRQTLLPHIEVFADRFVRHDAQQRFDLGQLEGALQLPLAVVVKPISPILQEWNVLLHSDVALVGDVILHRLSEELLQTHQSDPGHEGPKNRWKRGQDFVESQRAAA